MADVAISCRFRELWEIATVTAFGNCSLRCSTSAIPSVVPRNDVIILVTGSIQQNNTILHARTGGDGQGLF
jgi:hypothetical protein